MDGKEPFAKIVVYANRPSTPKEDKDNLVSE
jgi:hypothetical protein